MKADGLEDGYKVLADFNGTVEQLTEIYRCCADSVDGDFFELTGEQEKMIRSVQQRIKECVCRIWTSGSGSRKKPWNKPHRNRQCNIRMFLKAEPSNF